MKKLLSRSLVSALVVGSAFVVVPAQAQPEHPCYLHPPETVGDLWMCLCGEMADRLSPVIPPDQWDCGFPDIPPGGGN